MAVMRLIPSAYGRSNTNYVTVTNPKNMYNNTDHTSNYCTLRGRAGRSSNSTYYAFINGFNFDDVPSQATVTGFRVLIRAYRNSYMATGNTNYRIRLASQASNSYAIGNTTLSSDLGTTAEVYEIPTGSLTWDTLKEYGSAFSIDVPLRNSSTSSSYYPYIYVYGAEIEVTYTLPTSVTITPTLSGSGTISPSSATTTYEGAEYTLTITPTDTSATVTAKKNGTDIILVPHYNGGTLNTNLGTYTLKSGSFNGSGESYFEGIVGNGYNASQTTSNYYSGGSSTTAVFTYDMSFTNIPSNATIDRVYVVANGHCESTSNSSEYMCIQLKSGNTTLSEQYNWKESGSTSNSTYTLEATTIPTISQLSSMVLECTLGYYGGAINGATCYVEYSIHSGNPEYYTYTYTVDGNATIAVVIASGSTIYVKVNGSWIEGTAAYKKVNGSWVEVTDLTTLFDSNTNYIKIN